MQPHTSAVDKTHARRHNRLTLIDHFTTPNRRQHDTTSFLLGHLFLSFSRCSEELSSPNLQAHNDRTIKQKPLCVSSQKLSSVCLQMYSYTYSRRHKIKNSAIRLQLCCLKYKFLLKTKSLKPSNLYKYILNFPLSLCVCDHDCIRSSTELSAPIPIPIFTAVPKYPLSVTHTDVLSSKSQNSLNRTPRHRRKLSK